MTDEVIVERRISGRGEFRLPVDELRKGRRVVLYSQLLRRPNNEFRNFTWFPPKGFFANVTFWYNGSVILEDTIRYEQQVFDLFNGQGSQNLRALKCMNANIAKQLFDFSVAQGTPISTDNWIDDYAGDICLFDRVTIQAFDRAAFNLVLAYRAYDNCDPINAEFDSAAPPPPPPPPPTPLPPSTNIGDITPGYDDDGLYEDVTAPSPGDEVPPPPPEFPLGEVCKRYLLEAELINESQGRLFRSDQFYGVIEQFFVNADITQGNRPAVIVRSRGLAVFNGAVQPCGQPVTQIFLQTNTTGGFISGQILKVEEIDP